MQSDPAFDTGARVRLLDEGRFAPPTRRRPSAPKRRSVQKWVFPVFVATAVVFCCVFFFTQLQQRSPESSGNSAVARLREQAAGVRVELEDAERRRGPVLDGAPRREVPKQAMPAHVARDQSLLIEEAQRGDGVRVAAEHELGLGRGARCSRRELLRGHYLFASRRWRLL